MSNGYAGKTAIVTGGAKGIGEATARSLIAEGARVALIDIDDAAGEALAASLEGTRYWSVNVADQDAVNAAVSEIHDHFGSIDMLVNSAGVAPPYTLENIPDGEWQRVLDINLTGSFNTIQAVAPTMKEAGAGVIVNVASVAGKNISMAAGMHYTTSKWGLMGLSRHLAYELAAFGIRVNSVCPGPTLTNLIREIKDDATIAAETVNVPLGRWIESGDVANAIMFFLGPQSAMCAGAELIVDGGVLIGSGAAYDNYFGGRGSTTPERNIQLPAKS
jgi:NAD(P)-dependent dehydrogenase (short-subunit alcohol dehydrogenase family)